MAAPRHCSTKADFDAALQAAGSKLVVVDFTASWCGPCRMIAPTFESLAKKHTGSVFLKVDVDENAAVARSYSVSAMPTFVFIKSKSVVETLRGANPSQLTALVEKHATSGSGSGASFSGKGNTLSGGGSPSTSATASSSRLPTHGIRRPNPFGHESDEEDEEEGALVGHADQHDARREEEDAAAVDADVQAFVAQQRAAGHVAESARAKEERMKAGGVRGGKSRYQREKEEAERKKAEEELAAKEAYKTFAAAMEGRGATAATAAGPGDKAKVKPMGFVSAGGTAAYAPTRQSQAAQPSSAAPTAPRAMRTAQATKPTMTSMFGQDEDEDEDEQSATARDAPQVPAGPGARSKTGAMSNFLGELQRKQADREERYKDEIAEGRSVSSILAATDSRGGATGSRDTGDPATTNVCFLNLPANVSEKALGEFSSQWGDIASVKIMWPRGDESNVGGAGAGITALRNSRSAGLFGFVCFMAREDAERAFTDGATTTWGGCALHTSWGKAMPKPPMPRFFASRPALPSPSAQNDYSASKKRRALSPGGTERPHRRPRRSPSPRTKLCRQVEMEEPSTAQVIRGIAERVREYGPSFERLVAEREKSNPQFEWLRVNGGGEDPRDAEGTALSQHEYYRLLLNPRHEPNLPTKPFVDEDNDETNGPSVLYSSDSGEDSERERVKRRKTTTTASSTTAADNLLGPMARRRFESMLRCITPRRERIARAMAFAVEHAHAAEAVARILVRSLLLPETPLPRKLARLYVVSDILHNSSGGSDVATMPSNVWRYRQAFDGQPILAVMRHLGDVARSFPGIMKQEALRAQLRALVDVWEGWLVFAPGTLEELRRAIEVGSGAGGVGGGGELVSEKVIPVSDVAEPEALAAGEDDEDDIDGEAL